jgi:pimeloyl-ACP methyl ester carboxylesterase
MASRSRSSRRRTRSSGRVRAPKRSAAASAEPELPNRAAHPEFELRDDAVERALRTGEHEGLLEDYFGPENYAELRQLSRDVAARGVRGGPRVLILPGIMGSKIGKRRMLGLFDDVYWFDPVDIGVGRLTELALGPSGSKFVAVGVMLIAYLKLKLRLRAAGYNADFYPYDWRLSIPELGRQLARQLKLEGGDVDLVAHSMGGLVARAALATGAKCRRLVMLGTPNFGSLAPVMAMRATYPIVRKVGALDLRHTPEDLARDVFSTFPGLTQMLPNPSVFGTVDLYDLDNWPPDNLRPREQLLREVVKVQAGLAQGADNFYLIAGVDQQTPTGVRRDTSGQFAYEFSTAGDGTVPLDFARLPGVHATYYVAESHGSLPNNKRVARAVADLLARGVTDALSQTYAPTVRAGATGKAAAAGC